MIIGRQNPSILRRQVLPEDKIIAIHIDDKRNCN